MSEYKPCPFCGGKAKYDNDTGPSDEGFWEFIRCTDCSATADVDDWNRRVECVPDFEEVKAG